MACAQFGLKQLQFRCHTITKNLRKWRKRSAFSTQANTLSPRHPKRKPPKESIEHPGSIIVNGHGTTAARAAAAGIRYFLNLMLYNGQLKLREKHFAVLEFEPQVTVTLAGKFETNDLLLSLLPSLSRSFHINSYVHASLQVFKNSKTIAEHPQLLPTPMVGKWVGTPGGLCVFAETCGDGLALEHDGSLYSCDHYVYPEYKLGQINETPMREMLWSDRQMQFGQDKLESLTAQCRNCSFKFACNGGCPKHRFATSKNGEEGHNYFCESYTMFFHHTADRLRDMARLVAAGRPASEVARK